MRFLLLFLMAFAFTACTKTQICDNAKKITATAAPALAAAAECEVPSEVEAWMNDILADVKLCEKPVVSGPIGEFLCPIAYDAVHKAILEKGFPPKAKCKKIPGEDALKPAFMGVCTKI